MRSPSAVAGALRHQSSSDANPLFANFATEDYLRKCCPRGPLHPVKILNRPLCHLWRCLDFEKTVKSIPRPPSLPLDRAGRLRSDVVDDAVDAAHLVDDAGGDAAEEIVREREIVGGHAVAGGDGAQRADVIVGA